MTTDLLEEADLSPESDAGDRSVPHRRPAAALAGYAERRKRREIQQVVREFDDEVSAEQYEIIAAMADEIVDAVLAGPRQTLRAAAAEGDRATVVAGLDLFGLADRSSDRDVDDPDSETRRGGDRETEDGANGPDWEVEHDV